VEAADLVKHLDGLTACCHHWGMSKKSKKPKKANDLTGYESAQRKRFIRSEQESDNQETSSVLLWHKTYIKQIRQRFGLIFLCPDAIRLKLIFSLQNQLKNLGIDEP
jgi:hypothetical protein